jgi:hypothetical protein
MFVEQLNLMREMLEEERRERQKLENQTRYLDISYMPRIE